MTVNCVILLTNLITKQHGDIKSKPNANEFTAFEKAGQDSKTRT